MRKKINWQRTEYAENGELVCFGLSEHTMEEYFGAKWSDKAMKDISVLKSWMNPNEPNKHLVRPSYDSTFNPISYDNRSQLRMLLGMAVIRELPIKNFYARSILLYFYGSWFVLRCLGKGWRTSRPIVFYN